MKRRYWIIILLVGLFVLPYQARAADINLIIAVLECESSGKHDALGDGGASYGIAQFKEETFYRFVKQAGFKKFYYRNPIHQLRVMNWAIDNGYGNHWTCYQKLHQDGAPVMDSNWPVMMVAQKRSK